MVAQVLPEDLAEFRRDHEADFASRLSGVGRFRVNAYVPAALRPRVPPRRGGRPDDGGARNPRGGRRPSRSSPAAWCWSPARPARERPPRSRRWSTSSTRTARSTSSRSRTRSRSSTTTRRRSSPSARCARTPWTSPRVARRDAPGPRRHHGRRDARHRDGPRGAVAAETGHLVLATLHTVDGRTPSTASSTSSRPTSRSRSAHALAQTLRGIVSQRLVRKADGTGRALVCEVMVNTGRTAEAIVDPYDNRRCRPDRRGRVLQDADLRPAPVPTHPGRQGDVRGRLHGGHQRPGPHGRAARGRNPALSACCAAAQSTSSGRSSQWFQPVCSTSQAISP